MRRSVFYLLLILCLVQVVSADSLPDWARSLTSIDCSSWDSNKIPAVCLLDRMDIRIDDSGKRTRRCYQAYRILSDKGTDYARLSLPFDDDSSANLKKAAIQYPNGTITDMKNGDTTITQEWGDVLFSDKKRRVVVLPNAGKGAFVCFEYELKDHLLYPYENWRIQTTIPVLQSRLTVEMESGTELHWQGINMSSPEPTVSGNLYSFHWENLPPLADESYSPAVSDLVESLELTYVLGKDTAGGSGLLPDWATMGRWYYGLTRGLWTVHAAVAREATSICEGAADQEEKIRRLCRWVQTNIRYVSIVIGEGGLIPHAPAQVVENKHGDCKDMSFLLMTMLRSQGIQAWPVICQSRGDGMVNPDLPRPNQFNHCIVAIDHGSQGLVFFDPTSDSIGYPYLSTSLAGTWGLVAREDGGELCRLKGAAAPQVDVTVEAFVASDGSLVANVVEDYTPSALAGLRNTLRDENDSQRADTWRRILVHRLPDADVSGLTIENLFEPDLNLIIRYTVHSGKVMRDMGGLWMLRPFFIQDIGKPFFTEEKRTLPIALGNQTMTAHQKVTINYPSRFLLDEGLEPLTKQTDFARLALTVDDQPGRLVIEKTYSLQGKRLPPERFSETKQFFKTIRDVENSELIFVEK